MSCHPSEGTSFVRCCTPQYTLRFETVELANTWYRLFSKDTPERIRSMVASGMEPLQHTVVSEMGLSQHTITPEMGLSQHTNASETEPLQSIIPSEAEPIQHTVAPEPKPTQSSVESERELEFDMIPNETKPSRQCPITVEYLQQKLQEREERLRKTHPPCSIPPIPPPPPKRDHSTLKRRVELKNY